MTDQQDIDWELNESSLSASFDTGDLVDSETVILGEIVGACDLVLPDDIRKSIRADSILPFCTVTYGDNLIHKTKPALQCGLNPIWTASLRSLFLLRDRPKEFSSKSLTISVFAKEKASLPVRLLKKSVMFMGRVVLHPKTMLSHCDEERVEFDLQNELGEIPFPLGKIALRFRIATEADIQMVRLFQASSSSAFQKEDFRKSLLEGNKDVDMFRKGGSRPIASLITEIPESEMVQSGLVGAFTRAFSSNRMLSGETGETKVRVKPFPDPERKDDTTFMTQHEIKVETLRPSKKWVEAGSGQFGKVFLEILSCHGLPNVDMGEAVGNLTDSFVCAVYEDTVAMTEVIDDELSPHWLPWTQRAFCFGMMHPASILYLGVFDYDLGPGSHEPLGRVAVNLCNLQRNTIYTLKYNLYPSSNVTERIANGSITIRVRIECPDEKAALLESIKPRQKMHVNVKKEKTFKVVRYTCFGEYDNEEKFDLTVTKSYINEILEYKTAISYCIGDAVRSIMFWRGQVEIFSVLLPLHSFIFFMAASTLVERPHLVVPFTLLAVAWVMLALLSIRRQHPSPWYDCPSFLHFIELLRTGTSQTPIKSINAQEGWEATKQNEKAWKERLERDQKIAERKSQLEARISHLEEDFSTKVALGGLPISKEWMAKLGRWQGIIGNILKKFRMIKIIASWEESVVSFWITAAFLAAGLVSLLLPWAFILTWTSRIFVWGLFGPHMKLVDLTLRQNEKKEEALENLVKTFDVKRKAARLRQEEAAKLKDLKAMAFGKYSIQVPSFNLARHYDRPLPDSFARVGRGAKENLRSSPKASRRVSVVELPKAGPWIPGQQLYGAMIPRPEYELEIHIEELDKQQRQFEVFKDQVLSELNEDGDKKKKTLDFNASMPAHLGYEVVPHMTSNEDGEEAHIDSNHNDIYCETSQSRLSVLLSDHDSTSVDTDEDRERILPKHEENEPFCVSFSRSLDDQMDPSREEGFEVVATGHLLTIFSEDNDETDDASSFEDQRSCDNDLEDDALSEYVEEKKETESFYKDQKVETFLPLNSPPEFDLQNPSTSTETDVVPQSELHGEKMILLTVTMQQASTKDKDEDKSLKGLCVVEDDREEQHSQEVSAGSVEPSSAARRNSPVDPTADPELENDANRRTVYV